MVNAWMGNYNPHDAVVGIPYPFPNTSQSILISMHDDVIKWKHFPCYWPFVRGIHQSSVKFPHKDQWRRVLMFSLICVWTKGWVNNRDAGNLRRHRAVYDAYIMKMVMLCWKYSHMVPLIICDMMFILFSRAPFYYHGLTCWSWGMDK